jgi:hypothetical protein
MKRARPQRGVYLPWEERYAWLAELASGRIWRPLTLVTVIVGSLWVIWSVADQRSRVRVTRASIAEVQRAIAAFRAEVGRCPRSTVDLVHPPKASASYLNELPTDGWGRALYVRCPHRYDATTAEVISAGPSGSFLDDDNSL